VLIECYECKARVSDTAASCPHCGATPKGGARAVLPVEVSDLDMKLVSMFWFLLKAALAAIPALMVLYTALTVFSGIVTPLLH
jgi:hypothetical protein